MVMQTFVHHNSLFNGYISIDPSMWWDNEKLLVQKIRSNGDVGIWHETYKIKAGEYECVYNNMPRYGFGKVGELIPAVGRRESAAGRIEPS